MLAFFIMLVFGMCQFTLLSKLLENALKGEMTKTILYLFCKLGLYALLIPLVICVLKDKIIFVAAGLAIGMLLSISLFAMKTCRRKGDDDCDSTHNR